MFYLFIEVNFVHSAVEVFAVIERLLFLIESHRIEATYLHITSSPRTKASARVQTADAGLEQRNSKHFLFCYSKHATTHRIVSKAATKKHLRLAI